MNIRWSVFLFLLFCCFYKTVSASDSTTLKSPDGKLSISFFQQQVEFRCVVYLQGKPVLQPSPINFSIDGTSLTTNIQIISVDPYTINETYPVFGAHTTAVNKCKGLKISVRSGDFNWQLDVRAFNDGIAYRQLVSVQNEEFFPEETTVFQLPEESSIWYHDLEMHYEGVHVKKKISEVAEGSWMAPPTVFKLPQGIYACLTEADLLGYPGMAFQCNGKNGLVLRLAQDQPTSYPYRLRYSAEDTSRLKQQPGFHKQVTTPWRVLLVAKDLNTLVNSDIITNLNPPPDPTVFPKGIHTEWIKPGRAVWKYLNGGGDGTPEVMKHFTDAAAALGFEHNILEGFWTRWSDGQLKELVDYSRAKGVGIWLWKHSKTLRSVDSRDSFFRKCRELGIAGAKIDFFDSEAKEVIDLYDSILHDAARYHVLLDFHGANKPTGLMRTYPNSLVYEAVKGMEASKLADRATHETTIPFTRFLAGPAEYTVVHFGDRRKNTTWAHQIASAAILSAPMLTYAANPDTLLMNPAVDIIKSIPSTWDETRVLPPSEIGELAVYARRKGNIWFLAVMNGTTVRKINIPLTFLNGNYKTELAKDGAVNDGSIVVERKNYSSRDVLKLDLISGGGFIAKFSK